MNARGAKREKSTTDDESLNKREKMRRVGSAWVRNGVHGCVGVEVEEWRAW